MNVGIIAGSLDIFYIMSDELEDDDLLFEVPAEFYEEYMHVAQRMQYYQDVFHELLYEKQKQLLTGKSTNIQ